MSDLVGNPEDRFSQNEAHIKVGCKGVLFTQACYPDGKSVMISDFDFECETRLIY